MTSLAFSHLSQEESNKDITFLHASPGLVKTDIFARLTAPEGSSLTWRILLPVIQGLAGVMYWVLGVSVEDSGERQAFHLTSDKFKPGAWRVDPESEVVPGDVNGVVEKYVDGGLGGTVWEHTAGVFEKVLSSE
jgi:hypothetical protein